MNSIKRLKTLWMASFSLLLFTACGGGDSSNDEGGGEKPTPSPTSNSIVMSVKLTRHDVTTVVESDSAKTRGTYINKWGESTKAHIIGKQGGIVEDFGDVTVKSVTENVLGNFEVDLSKSQLNTKSSVDFYGFFSGMKGGVKDGRIYYDASQRRGFAPGYWFKTSSNSTTATAQLCGVTEILYITNKASNQILVTHNGFDTDEKWYYQKALIDIADNSIFETGDGNEVTTAGQFIAPNAMKSIITTYAPTGKAINNAQLIASINGTEVRSVNRITSNIIPQIGHIYAIYATWDGEKLVLGDEVTEVINISPNGDPKIQLISLDQDTTLTVSMPSNKVPKVGDYIVSEPIPNVAPYGLLRKVTSVETANETRGLGDDIENVIAKIKTCVTYVNEVLSDIHIDETIPFDNLELESVKDSEGDQVTFIANKDSKKLKFDKDVKFKGITFNLCFELIPDNLKFYLDVKDHKVKRVGLDFNYREEYKVTMKGEYKFTDYKDEYSYIVILKPWVFLVGEIPVVITPCFKFIFVLSADGTISVETVPIYHILHCNTSVSYNNPDDRPNDESCFKYFSDVVSNEDKSWYMNNYTDMKAELSTKLMMNADANFSVGLYGSNLVDNFYGAGAAVGLTPYIKYDGSLSLSYLNDLTKGKDDLEIDDDCKLTAGVDLYLKLYLKFWNPFSGREELELPLKKKVLEWDSGYSSTLFSDFRDIKLTSSNPKYIDLNVTKYKPLFTLFDEVDFGFCYSIDDGGGKNWTYCSLTDVYKGREQLLKYDINYSLKTDKFLPGMIYIIRPYTKVKIGGAPFAVMREGKRFRIDKDGSLSTTFLPDIPIIDL